MARTLGKNNQIIEKKEKGVKKEKKQLSPKDRKNRIFQIVVSIISLAIIIGMIAILLVWVFDKKDSSSETKDNAIELKVEKHFDDDYKNNPSFDRTHGPRVKIITTDDLFTVDGKIGNKPAPDNYFVYVYNSNDYRSIDPDDYDVKKDNNACYEIEIATDGILKLMDTAIKSQNWYVYIIDLADSNNATSINTGNIENEGKTISLSSPMLIKVTDEGEGTVVTATETLTDVTYVEIFRDAIKYIKDND